MEKYFCTYKQALSLKELGFDEPCFRCKLIGQEHLDYTPSDYEDFPEQKQKEVLIPLKSQVFEWFRKKYDLIIEPCVPFQRTYQTEEDYFEILEFGYRIFTFDQFRGGRRDTIEWEGYDNQIEEVAELSCIDKLIEIQKLN